MDNVTDTLFHLPGWYWYLQGEKDIRELNNRHQSEYFLNVFLQSFITNLLSFSEQRLKNKS